MVAVNGKSARAAVLAAGWLAACAPMPQPFPELPRLGLETKFGAKNLCSLGVSPAIALAGLPAGATRFTIRLTNLDALFAQAWEETVEATGPAIGEGAAPGYRAPCPGERQAHLYRVEVLALAADGRPLAYGRTEMRAIALSRLVRQERGAPPAEQERQPALPLPADPRQTPVLGPEAGPRY